MGYCNLVLFMLCPNISLLHHVESCGARYVHYTAYCLQATVFPVVVISMLLQLSIHTYLLLFQLVNSEGIKCNLILQYLSCNSQQQSKMSVRYEMNLQQFPVM